MAKRLQAASPATDQGVLIEAVLREVQAALSRAQGQLASGSLPGLDAVTLQLETETARQANGGFKILIFSFGRKWEETRSQQITLQLVPPPPSAGRALAATPTLAEHLVDAIVSAAQGVRNAATGQPPLQLKKFTAQFTFVVKTDTSGGAGPKFEIIPVTVDLKADMTKTARHVLTVTFAQ